MMDKKIANEKVTAIDDGTTSNKWGSININTYLIHNISFIKII